MLRSTRWIALIAFIVIAGYASKAAVPDEHNEKDKRSTSGFSFKKETRIDSYISPSTIARGWDAERAWSGYDDWEPAIAADPSSSYVYQMTTRYTGPAPCQQCPLPYVVFRASSDGGATWGPDQDINISRNKQNDP